MKSYKKALLVSISIILVLCFLIWKKGTPYGERYWSPNGRYYVQKYSNLTPWRLLPVMPGQGSDAIDGYIRLFDKNGTLIHEHFETFIRDIQPVWAGKEVYLMGVAEMDNDPWLLPDSSE